MTIRAQSVHKSVADSRSEERGGYRGVLEVHLDKFRGVLKYFAFSRLFLKNKIKVFFS